MDLAAMRPSTMVPRDVWARTERGVVCRYVIWLPIGGFRAQVLPIILARQPLQRGDVRVDALSDLVAMGLPGGSWVVLAASQSRLQPAVHIGAVPPAIWQMIEDARRRGGESFRIENAAPRWQPNKPVNLTRG